MPGDRVAVLSPGPGCRRSSRRRIELGLRRLREEFGLAAGGVPDDPAAWAPRPQARADDLHAAFADPSIRAVIAAIGGEDQIKVLRHLDPELLRANPKPFFGYSDNTNLLHYLWDLGIVGFHGGSVMVQSGRRRRDAPADPRVAAAALFTPGRTS